MNRYLKKLFIFLPLIAVIVVGGKVLMGKKEEVATQPLPKRPSIAIEMTQAKEDSLMRYKPFLAYVDVIQNANISSKLTGYIEAVYAREGDHVEKGQTLARIDDTEIQKSIESVRSSKAALEKELALKQDIHHRNQKLYDAQALPKEQLDASRVAMIVVESQVENLEKQIESLQNQLHYLHLRAPFAGIVATVFAHKGDLAAPSKPIVKLNSIGKKLTFGFTGQSIAAGQDVYHENVRIGRVNAIYDDAKNGLKVAEVALDQPIGYTSGENMPIDVRTGEVGGCVVDSRTILYQDDRTKVLQFKDGVFTVHDVTVVFSDSSEAVIRPCIDGPLAVASQTKLSLLPQYRDVEIVERNHEKVR